MCMHTLFDIIDTVEIENDLKFQTLYPLSYVQ